VVARGVLWGVGVGLGVAAVGQVIAFALFLAGGPSGSYVPYLRLGAVYVELFHHVGLEVRAAPLGGEPSFSIGLGVGLLLVPAGAVAILGLVGRRIRDPSPTAVGATVIAVAAGYAVVPFVSSFVANGRVPLPAAISAVGSVDVRVSAAAASAVPFGIAVVAVVMGALSAPVRAGPTSTGDARVANVVGGAVRAFALALLLSVVGLLALASVQPSFARGYAAVVDASDDWRGRVVVGGHAALLLPNQAIWVLVPAMGGCDEVVTQTLRIPFLCLWRVPATLPTIAGAETIDVTPTFGRPARGYLAFLLVPLVATVAGGMRAGAGARSTRMAVVLGAASGIIFAGLIAAVIGFARIEVRAAAAFLGSSILRLELGPELLRGTVLAAAWGIVGGGVGGAVSRYVGGAGTTAE
jgi:hypothetical protein